MTTPQGDFLIYRLGPLHRMRDLPLVPVDSTVAIALSAHGSTMRSADGTLTVYTTAHKREWGLTFLCLTDDEISWIRAVYFGLSKAPLRLVDPREPNRLSVNVSSGGAYDRTTRGFTASAGAIVFTNTPGPPDLAGMVDGAAAWTTTTAAADLTADTTPTTRVPVSDTDTVTFSAYVAGAGPVAPGVIPVDAAGVPGAPLIGATITAGAWNRLRHTATLPAGTVAVIPLLRALAGAARTITTTGWMLSAGDQLTDWVIGLGCPHVIPTDLSRTISGLSAIDLDLTLSEV